MAAYLEPDLIAAGHTTGQQITDLCCAAEAVHDAIKALDNIARALHGLGPMLSDPDGVRDFAASVEAVALDQGRALAAGLRAAVDVAQSGETA